MKLVTLLALVCLASPIPALAAPAGIDPAQDCAAQPWGLSPGVQPGDATNDMVPEIPATDTPAHVPAEMLGDLFLPVAKPVLGDQADLLLAAMDSVCISKKDHTLHLAAYFKDYFSLQLKKGPVFRMETYRADFPLVLKARISKNGKFVTVDFAGRRGSTLQLLAAVPLLSNRIYMHRIVINTETHWLQIFAGAMKDKVGVVAWSHFEENQPIIARLSFFQTLRRLFRPVPPTYVPAKP